MKASDSFTKVIKNHLEQLAAADSLFAETFKKANKNIADCITYILNTVKVSGCNGFADDEIFNMAMHYYDEDNIKPGKAINGRVVVNHTIEAEPTPKTGLVGKPKRVITKPTAKGSVVHNQISLFG